MPETLTRLFSGRKTMAVKPICLVVHAMGENILANDQPVPAWNWLEQSGLSVHALIYPNGQILRGVADKNIAYHAGESQLILGDKTWRGLNAMSLGAEFLLAGDHDYTSLLSGMKSLSAYTEEQYQAGAQLYAGWCQQYSLPVERIVRHSDVAGDDVRGPGNGKRDPGVGFDLTGFRAMVKALLEPPAP